MQIRVERLDLLNFLRLRQRLAQIGTRLFAKLINRFSRRIFNPNRLKSNLQPQILQLSVQRINRLVVTTVGLKQAKGLFAADTCQDCP